MKFTVFAALAAGASATSIRTSMAESMSCKNDYNCGANAYRMPNRKCYDTFDDCACATGYFKDKQRCVRELELTINNLSFQQPFSSFFVMVHSADATPLYRQGQPASDPLAVLAEDGNPDDLVAAYRKAYSYGVLSAWRVDGPLAPGARTTIKVRVNDDYDRVTIATMAINTNDCFTAVNGVALKPGDVLDLPGLDAGSEENNELCSSIPGPACASNSGNVRSKNGEGFVHVHRGFHGVNEGRMLKNKLDNGANGQPLSAVGYDWRNPMMRVSVSKY